MQFNINIVTTTKPERHVQPEKVFMTFLHRV